MGYKIGDRPTIKKDLKAGTIIGRGVTPAMEDFAGKTCTIKKVIGEEKFSGTWNDKDFSYNAEITELKNPQYLLEEDEIGFFWCNEMFESKKESQNFSFEIGNYRNFLRGQNYSEDAIESVLNQIENELYVVLEGIKDELYMSSQYRLYEILGKLEQFKGD